MSTPSSCDDRLAAVFQAETSPLLDEELFAQIQQVLAQPDTVQLGRRRGLDDNDLEDAGSRCLMALMRHKGRIDRNKAWRAFVRASVRNAIRDQARDKYRHPAASLSTGRLDVAAAGRTPLDLLAAREQFERSVARLLAGADARGRRIVELRLRGRTFQEIAEDLNVGLTVVFRAWKKRVSGAGGPAGRGDPSGRKRPASRNKPGEEIVQL